MRPRHDLPLTESWDGGVHRLPVQVRFRDTDMFGHVNNAVFATWIEIARIAFLRGLDPPAGDLILARLAIDFARQVRYPESVEVETRVGRVGRTSVTLDQRVRVADAEAARVDGVVVLYDYEAQASRPVPDALRAALRPYVVPDGATGAPVDAASAAASDAPTDGGDASA